MATFEVFSEKIKNQKYQKDFIVLELERQKLEIQKNKDERILKLIGFGISAFILLSVCGVSIYIFLVLGQPITSANLWNYAPFYLFLSPFISKITGISIKRELLMMLKTKLLGMKAD